MYYIVHYSEIGLKGDNRGQFEKTLINNIQNKLKDNLKEVKKISGKISQTNMPIHHFEILKGKDFNIKKSCYYSKLSKNLGEVYYKVLIAVNLLNPAFNYKQVSNLRRQTSNVFL